MVFDELVARYDADTDFPGYGLSGEQVARFYGICEEHIREKSTVSLKVELERLLDAYGDDANEAMYTFMGSDDIHQFLEDYDDVSDTAWKSLEEDWKESYLLDDISYLPRHYPDDLERIWMEESRFEFWQLCDGGGRTLEALDAVIEFLSGYPTLEALIAAC